LPPLYREIAKCKSQKAGKQKKYFLIFCTFSFAKYLYLCNIYNINNDNSDLYNQQVQYKITGCLFWKRSKSHWYDIKSRISYNRTVERAERTVKGTRIL